MGNRGPKAGNQSTYTPAPSKKNRPGPPAGMTLRAHRIWKKVVASLPTNHFRASDYPLLRAYCEAEALHFEASQKIGEEGAIITRSVTKKDRDTGEETTQTLVIKANPWVAIQTQTAHTMSQLATKLRLCANARKEGNGDERPPGNSRRKGLLFGEEEWPPQ